MKRERPDVILLDLTMPRMDGLTFLKQIMAEDPIPVVICSVLARESSEAALRALELGAVDVVAKPVVDIETGAYVQDDATRIVETVLAAAKARVHRRARPAAKAAPVTAPLPTRVDAATTRARAGAVVAIGASTGGPAALQEILAALPATTPGVLIVQHMPGAFTEALARRLDSLSPLCVKEAKPGDRVEPGHVLVAPGDRHMALVSRPGHYRVKLFEGPLVNRHRPSVDVLFRSVAEVAGVRAVGVLLTGMGEDGVAGLHEMKNAGAVTIAQNQESCVVFGMPKQAIGRGIVDRVVPLGGIPRAILKSIDGDPR
jgi:two-component system chemotaxis response regulator CheB